MNDITNITQLTAEIVLLKNQTAQNIIEIGKRLIEVKEQLPHGEWGKWLEDKVDFTQWTATRFMRVANEISNSTSLTNLSQTKVFALLDIPQDQREDFIQSNPVDEMTTRQLAQAIKDKKEAERQLEVERNKPARIVERVVEKIPSDYNKLKTDIENQQKEARRKEEYLQSLKDAYDSAKKRIDKYESTERRIEALTKQEEELSKQINIVTELSTLSCEIESLLKEKLAPIRYAKSLSNLENEVVRKNFESILNNVSEWLSEMEVYLKHDYMEVEYESVN